MPFPYSTSRSEESYSEATRSTRLGKLHAGSLSSKLTIGLQELLAISDAYVENTLRAADASQGKWLNEDPSLAQIQQILMTRR